jgi:hypothetical protein
MKHMVICIAIRCAIDFNLFEKNSKILNRSVVVVVVVAVVSDQGPEPKLRFYCSH